MNSNLFKTEFERGLVTQKNVGSQNVFLYLLGALRYAPPPPPPPRMLPGNLSIDTSELALVFWGASKIFVFLAVTLRGNLMPTTGSKYQAYFETLSRRNFGRL